MATRLLLFLLFCSSFLTAQTDTYARFPFPDNSDSGIQSPADFLGYRLGERFTEYAKTVAYCEYLAEASSRVQLVVYGETYEKRPLIYLTVSSAENMDRIDSIRNVQQQLVGAATLARTQVQTLLETQPVINSYSYNIHGNEASGTEAAMQFAYELATTEDPERLSALSQTINLLFMCINPDGRDRYVYWYNGMARATGGEEPHDLEHHAPWPNGRTNHYWFDLNRDWVWGVHPESRGHTAAYQDWMPSIHTDYHEQGYNANYFTVPGTTPRNLLLPDAYEGWADTFGRANIAQFDRKGLSYFTRDRFDFYYPSYGSSYPSVMGAIGMLTEQGGIAAGRAVTTEDDYVLYLRQRVWDHFTTSVAQVLTAAENREELQAYSLSAWDPLASKEQTIAYLIEEDGSDYVGDFIDMLLLNGVEVERTTEDVTANGTSYREGGASRSRQHPAGSYIIATEQPRHLFINSIMSSELSIEDSVMYDMSTWSAPLAYNLNAYTFAEPLSVTTERVDGYRRESGVFGPSEQVYAYVIDYTQRQAPRALAALWQAGVRVRAASAPFTDDSGRQFSAGSLIVLRGRNQQIDDLPGIVRTVADEVGIRIDRFATGRMASGNDLANTRNFPVEQPRVALLVSPPFNTYTSGQIYFLFDWETRLPVERLRPEQLRQTAVPKFGSRYGIADLTDYDVLILPESRNLGAVFGEMEQESVLRWIKAGGTLIAMGRSATYLARQDELVAQPVVQPAPDSSAEAATLTYAERTRYYGLQNIPGAALRASIDTTHPLGFGLPQDVYTLKFGRSALQPTRDLLSVGRYLGDAEDLLAAGYAPTDGLGELAGNAWAGVRTVGEGRIVFLVDNPHYRMFWRGPSRLMQNAVMIVPGM